MSAFTECAEATLERLGSDKAVGLSGVQVVDSRKLYGVNVFSKVKGPSLFCRVFSGVKEPMIILLFVAAFVTLGVNLARYFSGGMADFLECGGIFVAILLSVIITVVMEGRSVKAFEALNKLSEEVFVKVIREGCVQLVLHRDVVVGDIVCVETGDRVPADGRLLESFLLCSDESVLTGESVAVSKDANVVFDNVEVSLAERVNMFVLWMFYYGWSG